MHHDMKRCSLQIWNDRTCQWNLVQHFQVCHICAHIHKYLQISNVNLVQQQSSFFFFFSIIIFCITDGFSLSGIILDVSNLNVSARITHAIIRKNEFFFQSTNVRQFSLSSDFTTNTSLLIHTRNVSQTTVRYAMYVDLHFQTIVRFHLYLFFIRWGTEREREREREWEREKEREREREREKENKQIFNTKTQKHQKHTVRRLWANWFSLNSSRISPTNKRQHKERERERERERGGGGGEGTAGVAQAKSKTFSSSSLRWTWCHHCRWHNRWLHAWTHHCKSKQKRRCQVKIKKN